MEARVMRIEPCLRCPAPCDVMMETYVGIVRSHGTLMRHLWWVSGTTQHWRSPMEAFGAVFCIPWIGEGTVAFQCEVNIAALDSDAMARKLSSGINRCRYSRISGSCYSRSNF